MTTYYIGPGGDDGEDGLTWENRRLTILMAENLVTSPNDTLIFGPGRYDYAIGAGSESGTAGNPITYYGDVTGEFTDGIGGKVRVTTLPSDDSEAPANPRPLSIAGNYRELYNFTFDMATNDGTTGVLNITDTAVEGSIVDSCVFGNTSQSAGATPGIELNIREGKTNSIIIRNCIFMNTPLSSGIYVYSFLDDPNTTVIIENCLFYGCNKGIWLNDGGGVIIRNNTFISCSVALDLDGVTADTNYIYQNMFLHCGDDYLPDGGGSWVKDYNVSFDSGLDGANGINSIPYYDQPVLLNGFKFPGFNTIYNLNGRTAVIQNGDNNAPSDDIYSLTRPGSGKKTPGAVQYRKPTRETSIVASGSTSVKIPDAGRHIYLVQLNGAVPHSFSVKIYHETNYAGTLPQMIIKRVGESDITITDTGSADQWNTLKHTFTPNAGDKWAQIEFVSNNTATSGDYGIYVDSFLAKSKGGRTKAFLAIDLYIANFNKKPVDDVWITLSTVVFSPTVEPFDSHLPPYIN